MDKIVIASRESRLAMWQAEHIRARLQSMHPGLTVEILGMTTKGDQILDKTLAKIGGKGLFVKELEVALAEGRADLAVHSIKDVPMVLPDGFALAAICTREDPCDAFVSNRYQSLAELPDGAVVGTSSLRREAQLRARFPRLVIRPLRGNVQTRLAKLDNGDYDAIILAAAGLKRLGLVERIAATIAVDDSLPAAGQGALGIEIRADRTELATLLAGLNDADTHACVSAERTLAREMGGSCQLPLGAFATLQGDVLHLTGLLAHPDGSVMLRADAAAPREYAEALGRAVAKKLYEQDAGALIDDILRQQP
ncbi:hydroxymethylbilane synthase [Paludibacterium purpuratum]|uniref:Porphobilinogen deaminase n=1 Tax=Paludibacterium purpuratum TaxID=1144873 RepID=A0A4V3DUQ4_9NEIS|nr:hydroxymethylbilane synthase [Paludibacterium purpuratum]TDR76507.1 hydroxymethylbilane synthase [Paludibacterium purpuratum]